MTHKTDNDISKGATETESPQPRTNSKDRPDIHGNLSNQLPHRGLEDEAGLDEDNGTDFPEPGSNPEHSGQKSR